MLKKTLLTLVVISALAMSANAALVAFWSFDSYNGTQNPVSPEIGSGTLTTTSSGTTTYAAGTGTTANDPRPSPTVTPSLNIGTGTGANASSFTIRVTGTGFSGFTVTYESAKNGSAVDTYTWEWSTDNSTFNPLTTISVTPSGYGLRTVDATSVTQLDNAANVYLRATLSGASGSSSTADFDNFQVTAVPEPINMALVLFGLAFCGVKFGRRLISSARS